MTDDMDEYQTFIDSTKTAYKLPSTPSYIDSVFVSSPTLSGIKLTETKNYNSLKWTTIKKSVTVNNKTISYKVIKSGNYYYDYYQKKIYIPLKDQDDNLMSTFQKNLSDTNLTFSYLPTILSVLYYDGNGKSITLPAIAQKNGPSYMIQKGAITTIVSTNNLEQDSNGTCIILDPNGNAKNLSKVEWICTNNKPSTLSIESQSKSYNAQGSITNYNAGQFKLPSFNGKQIHNLVDPAKAAKEFKKLYGENAQFVRGKCETEVTFTGPPNKILSGNIIVKAQAETKYSYQIGKTTVTYNERTGGIKDGFIVFHCTPKSTAGRATVCYGVPTLLIYAKERNPYSSS